MTIRETPPKYDVAIVEAVILEVAVGLHPEHLSMGGLLRKIVGDPDDTREMETGVQAIRNLREFRLFADREDEIVQPTPAALRAYALLGQPQQPPSADAESCSACSGPSSGVI
jgi:hypothetical protein